MNDQEIDLQKWLSDEQYQLLQLLNDGLWDTDLRIIARLRKRNSELQEKVFVSGNFICPECDFYLTKASIDANTGQIGIRNKEEVPECGNGCGKMERQTWKRRAKNNRDRLEEELWKNSSKSK